MNIREQVRFALAEDIQTGDIHVQLSEAGCQVSARVITREAMIMCGQEWVSECFRQVDSRVQIQWLVHDGQKAEAGQTLMEIKGEASSLLTAERTALNFLQLLSATATQTRQYVDAIKDTQCQLLDTRKTVPLFRHAQKYAVRCGGGSNHRVGLYDAFIIKENHILACGSITLAAKKAREIDPQKKLEIEVENLIELQEAIDAQVDVAMLDNFTHSDMVRAVALNAGRIKLEASGNVTLDTIHQIADTGVDYISVGATTKNIHAIDLSMRLIR